MLQRKKVAVDRSKLTAHAIDEWREPGTRNFIRVGDVVRVLPSAPRKRDGFEARVRAIEEKDGQVVFTVVGGNRGRVHIRSIRADRVARVAQVRGGERRERKR